MSKRKLTFVGIDVGGVAKGFHAVALRDCLFIDAQTFTDPTAVVGWCLGHAAHIVAVDAPCKWSQTGSSRLAERTLNVGGRTIQCFKTPTRNRAMEKPFYDWVFNGERLYTALATQYPLFDGQRRNDPVVFETFPHAVVCMLAGRVVPARPKAATRRLILAEHGYHEKLLKNIDFVDAALCAITAARHAAGHTQWFGDNVEGHIVVPN